MNLHTWITSTPRQRERERERERTPVHKTEENQGEKMSRTDFIFIF
jgi:hypothetical protein